MKPLKPLKSLSPKPKEKTMNDKSNKALLKLEMGVWIKQRAKKLKCSEKEIREYLSIEVLGCKSIKTIENYLYSQIFPVTAKHAVLLNRAMGIKLRVLNPDLWK